jgi:hypothetical protein
MVFEYIEVDYNRMRRHSTNGYIFVSRKENDAGDTIDLVARRRGTAAENADQSVYWSWRRTQAIGCFNASSSRPFGARSIR